MISSPFHTLARRCAAPTTGYAVPAFVVDAPGGGGKIQLLPDSVVGRDGDDLILRNFEGNTYRYPDPLDATDSPSGPSSQ